MSDRAPPKHFQPLGVLAIARTGASSWFAEASQRPYSSECFRALSQSRGLRRQWNSDARYSLIRNGSILSCLDRSNCED